MNRLSRPFLILLLILTLFALSVSAAAPTRPNSQVVTFPNPGPDVLVDLAGQGWDIWEVTPSQVTAQLTPGQVTALHARGIETTSLGDQTLALPSFPACYRTYATAVAQLQAWAAAYPQLIDLIDAGPSWETIQGQADRRLWTLRITNERNDESKPSVLIAALHHAREIITPEVALNLSELLLTGYGVDPDITWLVDNREIWIMPFANPDGHVRAARGENWRKNVNDTVSGCSFGEPPNSVGIDLNRNYDFKWATIGASDNPCKLTYHGPAGFSEPETRAIRDLVQAQKFNLVLSLHSYSDLILYSWGYTYAPAPDESELQALASVLATFNGYTPQQSSDLYPTSGDTCDWVYGAEGIPCLTFEIGGWDDGAFWPNCTQQQEQWLENRDALLHAIKLAGNPYRLAQAPVVRQIHLQHEGRRLTVQALLDQSVASSEPPAGEMFVDQIGVPATGISLQPGDQVLNTPVETMTATIDLTNIQDRRTLYVVGAGDDGQHGPPAAVYFQPCLDVTGDGSINAADVSRLAELWHTLAFDPWLDLNADGRIDIVDIGMLTAEAGTSCSP